MPRETQKQVEATESRSASRAFWVLGNHLTVLADHADTGGRYDLIEGHQPPGDRTPPHVHTRYVERIFVVDGELTVWVDGDETILHGGDTFAIPADAAHIVTATGAGTTHALVVTSPSGFAHLIEEVGIPDTGGGRPEPTPFDLERFVQVAARHGDEILGPLGTLPERRGKRSTQN